MMKKLFSFKHKKSIENITLNNIENKMYELGFNQEFAEEIMMVLDKIFNELGQTEFQRWFHDLHFSLPEPFKDESLTMNMYDKHSLIIEEQIKELEKSTKLSWEVQAEDLNMLHENARKTQLVIRDRLSNIALELLDERML